MQIRVLEAARTTLLAKQVFFTALPHALLHAQQLYREGVSKVNDDKRGCGKEADSPQECLQVP